jgi:glycine betaine/proline transport system ATP-binding protein
MPEGEPIRAGHTILQLARQLVNDTRDTLPVATRTGEYIGVLDRQEALNILLGEK